MVRNEDPDNADENDYENPRPGPSSRPQRDEPDGQEVEQSDEDQSDNSSSTSDNFFDQEEFAIPESDLTDDDDDYGDDDEERQRQEEDEADENERREADLTQDEDSQSQTDFEETPSQQDNVALHFQPHPPPMDPDFDDSDNRADAVYQVINVRYDEETDRFVITGCNEERLDILQERLEVIRSHTERYLYRSGYETSSENDDFHDEWVLMQTFSF